MNSESSLQSNWEGLNLAHCDLNDSLINHLLWLTLSVVILYFNLPIAQVELESLPLASILQTSTVLDSCAFNSLLAVTVQERYKRTIQVYIFQCEEVGVSQKNAAKRMNIGFNRAVQLKPDAYIIL